MSVNIMQANGQLRKIAGNARGEGEGGVSDYTELENLPKIEGVTLTGDKSAGDLGLVKESDLPGEATTAAAGLMSSADKVKLNGVATGAEVNQNAFSRVTVGSTNLDADSKTDTLTFVAGNNIQLTADASNDQISIAATNEITFAQVIIATASWSNDTYSFESQYPSASYDILDVVPIDGTTTDEQREAWISADCYGYNATNIIKAKGAVPSVNIPVQLCLYRKG